MFRRCVARRIWERVFPVRVASVVTGIFIAAGGVTVIVLAPMHAWASVFCFIPASIFIGGPLIIRRRMRRSS